MPDSLAPYLNEKQRSECIDLYELQSEAKVENTLKGTTHLDTLSANYLRARLSTVRTIEMFLLPQAQGDSLLCVIDTYAGPKKESSIKLYSQDWNLKHAVTFCIEQFMEKPDTMSAQRFGQLKSVIDHYFICANWDAGKKELAVQADTDWTFMDDNKQLSAMLKDRKFRWKEGQFQIIE